MASSNGYQNSLGSGKNDLSLKERRKDLMHFFWWFKLSIFIMASNMTHKTESFDLGLHNIKGTK